MTSFTDLQKLNCLERELKMRRKVYPAWVRDGKMTAEYADYQIAIIAEIAREYRDKVQPDLLK